MKASRNACCCCSANGSNVGWRMAPVWIPPVTVKLEPSAAIPSALFERAETGASPLSAAMLVTLCASAAAHPIIRTKRPVPHPSLVMAPLWQLADDALSRDPSASRVYTSQGRTGSPGARPRVRLLAHSVFWRRLETDESAWRVKHNMQLAINHDNVLRLERANAG